MFSSEKSHVFAASLPPTWRRVTVWARAMRVHQWVKNTLIFVPLVLGGMAGSLYVWLEAATGFLALSLTCSATYLINDVWDLESDREHSTKRRRPIAAGELTSTSAIAAAIAGVSLGLSLTSLLNASATILLVTYLALTLTYTFYLKRVAILDVFVIAGLFTLRLAMGVAITGVRLSPWLMVFSMFSFLSLCLAKRYTEILGLTADDPAATARGYMTADAPLILALGVAATLGSILIFVLYLIEDAFPQNLYSSPYFLWALPCILFLLFSRTWLVAQRRVLNDDPVEFVLTDPQSLGLGIAALLTIALALA